MSISPISSGSPITRLQGSKAVPSSQSSQDVNTPGEDTVQFSDSARYLSEIQKLPDVRQDKVDNARASIANGTLDTPENLDTAVGNLLNEIG